MVEPKQILQKLRRPPDSHKGHFGHVLVLGGSTGFAGAACLAADAALRGGAGLVTLGVPASLLPIVATKLTACMTRPFREVRGGLALGAVPDVLSFANRCEAIALGPGIGRHRSTAKLVHALLRRFTKPIVLDADGLNALVGETDVLKEAAGRLVLTPHPGEMARLTGLAVADLLARRAEAAAAFARDHRLVLVLKGHHTLVTDGTQLYENHTGNPGMASGGTGDVLTGLLAALIAQRLDPFDAAVLGVYVHGLAGDLAVAQTGEVALTATDLLGHLGAAFLAADKSKA